MKKMKVLYVATEASPFFKTGGLGDVAGALPKALAARGLDVRVFLPYFDKKIPERFKKQIEDVGNFQVEVGWRSKYCGIKKIKYGGVEWYFIDDLDYFGRDGLYGYYDDGERFGFYSLAVIEAMQYLDFIPDVVHVNDYHTAMVPFLLREKYHWVKAFEPVKTVLTIHNIEFQGQMDPTVLTSVFGVGMERYDDGTVRYEDGLNFMKAGILYADEVTTVSPSYAAEIQTPEFGKGLDGVLRSVSGKLTGILNGIDDQEFDPATDAHLEYHYSLKDLTGKFENKKLLQKKMGLPVEREVPLIGIVSRLTQQKGFQLVLAELEKILQQDVQLVVLGTGDADMENGFRYFAGRFPEKCTAEINFDLELAQLIYAGSDLFLMPSAFEPCGLSQMIAMRYGTLPIVHEIGGLKDTVTPFDPVRKTGTGFGFQLFQPNVLAETVLRAVDLYWDDQKIFHKLMTAAMEEDFSWQKNSAEYVKMYSRIISR